MTMTEQAGWFRRQWIGDLLAFWGYAFPKRRDSLLMAVAWRLPRRLVMWCYIRVVAHATTGRYGETVVPELTAMDALGRWEDRRG